MSRTGRVLSGVTGVGKGEPILRRKSDAPSVAGKLQLQSHLEELPDGARTLNPGDAAADGPRRVSGLRMRYLERDPHIFQDVVLRLVATAVAIDDEGGSTFVEGATERVHTCDAQRNSLNDARAAAL